MKAPLYHDSMPLNYTWKYFVAYKRALLFLQVGAHGKPVVFLHPKDCGGVLIELEEK